MTWPIAPRVLLVAAVLIAAPVTVSADDLATAVPVVGCPGDGQLGPVDPEQSDASLTLPAARGGRLAYYIFQDIGVLAPKGWHCFGLYGSDGMSLLVTPDAHSSDDFFRENLRVTGSAVQLSRTYGGTSGRFRVARVAARVFPIAHDFVRQVVDESKRLHGRGFDANKEFPVVPYPADKLTRRNATTVEFETPRNRDGLGTASLLRKTGAPITGVAILVTDDMDLVQATVRLPAEMRDVSPMIIGMVERTLGQRLDDAGGDSRGHEH